MTKAEFKILCAKRGVQFTGYSGKTKTAYINGSEPNLSAFYSLLGQMAVPFEVKTSAL